MSSSAQRRIEHRAARWNKRQARIGRRRPPRPSRLGEAGTARGVCIDTGCRDAGWVMPPPVVLFDGTTVQLYKDGQGLTAALRAIRAATEQICLEVYIFHSDETGRAFASALAEKARQGVKVFVIYDSFGSIDTDPAMFGMMRAAGVHVAEFHPLRPWDCKFGWRPVNRDHRKLLVIDNRIAGLGGLNVGTEYGSGFLAPKARRCDLWRDNGIGLVGPSVQPFAESFARTWRYVHRGGKIAAAQMVHNINLGPRVKVRGGRVSVLNRLARFRDRLARMTPSVETEPKLVSDIGLLASVPTGSSALIPFVHTLVQRATTNLDLTIAYFAPADHVIADLCRAARRGVRVRLMLPGRCDVPAVRFAAHSFYETLLDAGVQIWERQGAVLHSKTMVVDQEISVIGSTNLDYRSIESNCELSAVIRNAQLGAQMAALFEHDIEYAKKISLREWRRRPWRDRLVQWAASRARYLL